MAEDKPAKPDPFGDAIKAFYGQSKDKTKEFYDALALAPFHGQVFAWNLDTNGPILYSDIQCDPLKWAPPPETEAKFYARRLREVWPW